MTLALVVALAGGTGALARYVVDGLVSSRTRGAFPWGTTVINVTGSLVLGILTGLAWYHDLGSSSSAIWGTGFCGGLTTWSTASFESLRLFQTEGRRLAATYLFGGLVAGCAAGVAGIAVAAL